MYSHVLKYMNLFIYFIQQVLISSFLFAVRPNTLSEMVSLFAPGVGQVAQIPYVSNRRGLHAAYEKVLDPPYAKL